MHRAKIITIVALGLTAFVANSWAQSSPSYSTGGGSQTPPAYSWEGAIAQLNGPVSLQPGAFVVGNWLKPFPIRTQVVAPGSVVQTLPASLSELVSGYVWTGPNQYGKVEYNGTLNTSPDEDGNWTWPICTQWDVSRQICTAPKIGCVVTAIGASCHIYTDPISGYGQGGELPVPCNSYNTDVHQYNNIQEDPLMGTKSIYAPSCPYDGWADKISITTGPGSTCYIDVRQVPNEYYSFHGYWAICNTGATNHEVGFKAISGLEFIVY